MHVADISDEELSTIEQIRTYVSKHLTILLFDIFSLKHLDAA